MWKVQEIKRIRWRTGGRGLCLKPAGGKLESPLGCSCQDSRKADVIHLITSHRLKEKQQNPRGLFLLNWAKGTQFPPLGCAGAFSVIKQHRKKTFSFSFGIRNLKHSENVNFKRINQIFKTWKSRTTTVTCALIVASWQISIIAPKVPVTYSDHMTALPPHPGPADPLSPPLAQQTLRPHNKLKHTRDCRAPEQK